jgi:hypothetical protein
VARGVAVGKVSRDVVEVGARVAEAGGILVGESEAMGVGERVGIGVVVGGEVGLGVAVAGGRVESVAVAGGGMATPEVAQPARTKTAKRLRIE